MRAKVFQFLFVVSSVAALIGALVAYNHNATIGHYEQQVVEQQDEIEDLRQTMTELEQTIQEQSDLLDSRSTFNESFNVAKAALMKAETVTNVQESLNVLVSAQESVIAEANNPATVLQATETVKRETGRLTVLAEEPAAELPAHMLIADYEVATDSQGLQTLPSNHPARIALNIMGGADIRLGAADRVCESPDAAACAYSSNIILIANDYTDANYDLLYNLLMHEYAHQVQFKHHETMQTSDGFVNLFNNDMEWMADCMAAAKLSNYISGYGNTCSDEQVSYGEQAWNGFFP